MPVKNFCMPVTEVSTLGNRESTLVSEIYQNKCQNSQKHKDIQSNFKYTYVNHNWTFFRPFSWWEDFLRHEFCSASRYFHFENLRCLYPVTHNHNWNISTKYVLNILLIIKIKGKPNNLPLFDDDKILSI